MSLILDIDRRAWKGLAGPERKVRAAVRAAFAAVDMEANRFVLSVILANDATVRSLNRRWRRIDKPTNVLSFPQPANYQAAPGALLGDVVLAGGVVAREAREQGKPLANHASHLIVHGVLHLLGHDHHGAADAEEMQRLEIRALAALGIADPYTSA